MSNEASQHLPSASLQDLQQELFRLLKIIHKVCQDNNIEYWLDLGTLLGAVRHQGFIPWDGDIDISVPASDYHRLISALDQEAKHTHDIFLHYGFNNVPKFFLERLATTRIIQTEQDGVTGCFIDIFPARIIDKKHKDTDTDVMNTVKYFVTGMAPFGAKVQRKYIKSTLNKAAKEKQKFMSYFHHDYLPSCNHRATDSLISSEAILFYAKSTSEAYMSYADVFPLKRVTFEGLETFAPKNTDKYLTTLYGDYMTPPPKSQRVAKYENEIYWCESSDFAIESTIETLSQRFKSFYRHPIYQLVREWDRNRRKRKSIAKKTK